MIAVSLRSDLGAESLRPKLLQLNLNFTLTDLGNGETILAFSVDSLHVNAYTHIKKLAEPFEPIDISSALVQRRKDVRRISGSDQAV